MERKNERGSKEVGKREKTLPSPFYLTVLPLEFIILVRTFSVNTVVWLEQAYQCEVAVWGAGADC